MVYRCRAQQRTPRFDLIRLDGLLAIDCEGVQLPNEEGWRKNGCGRVSIVNEKEEAIYDTFVHYGRNVEHRPPPQWRKLGVIYNDIKPKYGAIHINEVHHAVRKIFDRLGSAGIVVGHALINEMQYLRDLDWSKYQTRDTQRIRFNQTGSPKLRDLASAVLGRQIQTGEHSSVDDAPATMALYLFRQQVDAYDSGISRVSPSKIEAGEEEIIATHRASVSR